MAFSPDWIARAILFFLMVEFLLRLLSDGLNLNAISGDIPGPMKGFYAPQRYRLAQAYLRANTRFGLTVRAIDLAVLLGFWHGGGFAAADTWSRSLGWGPLGTGLAYIGGLAGLKAALDQPFSLYATFVIEQRFGFNRTRFDTWLKDRFKMLLLAVFLGGPLLGGILAFFHVAGETAWLWCWGLITLFTLVIQFILPTWIMPLFNRFDPLADGELKSAILTYTRSIDFALEDVYVMDGSRRSSKSNAFFTGFGRHRRIVLFDTLVERQSADELLAVLAHEMGHYKMHHIPKMIAAGILQTGLLLFLMSRVIDSPALFAAFGVATPSVHAGLIFFGLLYSPVDFFLGLAVQAASRKHEFAADRFAATTTGKSAPMISALKTLSVDNLANLTPHPLHVFLNHSHPPILQRIAALQEIDRGNGTRATGRWKTWHRRSGDRGAPGN